jgi:hypothetical protein
MPWESLIPTTMAAVGGSALILGIFLVYVDVPGKGVPWDKVGALFAVIGGFGAGGAAGGALGGALANLAASFLTAGQRVTVQLVGVAVGGSVIVGVALWVYSRIQGKGIATKSKFRSLILVLVLATAGAVFANLPGVYPSLNKAIVYAVSTFSN